MEVLLRLQIPKRFRYDLAPSLLNPDRMNVLHYKTCFLG